jgi:hypothetical protein
MKFLHYLVLVPMAAAIAFLLSSDDTVVRVLSFVALVILEQIRDVLVIKEISESLSAKALGKKPM